MEEQLLRVDVIPGEPVRWAPPVLRVVDDAILSVAVVGPTLRHPFVVGEVMNHSIYDDFKRAWLDNARAQGFLDAYLSVSRLRIEPQRHLATAELSLVGGPRYRVRELRLDLSHVPYRDGRHLG